MPIRPIIRKPPRDVRSLFVTQPKILHARKVAEQTKKVLAMDWLVYILKIIESVAPFSTA